MADETTTYDYDANDRLKWEQFDGPATDTTTFYQYDGTTHTQKTVYDGIHTSEPGGTFKSQTINTYNVRGRLETVAIDRCVQKVCHSQIGVRRTRV